MNPRWRYAGGEGAKTEVSPDGFCFGGDGCWDLRGKQALVLSLVKSTILIVDEHLWIWQGQVFFCWYFYVWQSTVDATCAKFCYHQKAGHETRPKNQCTEASFPFGTPAFVLNASYARLWCPTQLPLLHLIFAFDSNSLTSPSSEGSLPRPYHFFQFQLEKVHRFVRTAHIWPMCVASHTSSSLARACVSGADTGGWAWVVVCFCWPPVRWSFAVKRWALRCRKVHRSLLWETCLRTFSRWAESNTWSIFSTDFLDDSPKKKKCFVSW